MKRCLTFAAVIYFFLLGYLSAQPIRSPFEFVQSGRDTVASAILPVPPTSVSRVVIKNGHFYLSGSDDERIRFFGTELEYTSQFISGADARVLAKHLHKLGFNAVRLVDNDYHYWNAASFFINS